MNRHLSTSAICVITASLTACGGDDSPSTTTATQALFVNAGADISANERQPVSVTAQSSGGGTGATIEWSQLSGPMVDLRNSNSLNLNFAAPSVRRDETVALQVEVRTSDNRTATDQINIVINNVGDGPVGPSPQGIPDNGRNRRGNARGNREGRRMFDSREVRTYDGSNNNVANTEWGASFIHLQRLANSAYGDGVSSLAGAARINARDVSNQMINQNDGVSIPNTFDGTDFVWQWGQFLDHDIDLTDGAEESADIIVSAGDVHFDPDSTGTAVISFNRALFDPNTGFTAANPREQENEITSWIDGSMIYGSSDERITALRVGSESPLLKTSEGNLLPFNETSLTNANGFITDPTRLFLAGDIRANEQLALATMHTLWVREHNRIAEALADDFPNNTADEIFELTRRLVVAKIQMITYSEWLPVLIGSGAIPAYAGYDAAINPSIYNEFSGASFRLGHSMLNERLLRLDASGNEIADGHIDLSAAFFTAPMILTSESSIDPILRGLATQRHQALDEMIVDDLRNFLFGAPGDGGLDLASLNIQRGRDHGLPDYNSMRVAMGLPAVLSFGDISSNADTVTSLSATYSSVDDIDLWVGGLSEDAVGASQLGPLFQAIIARQFTELRDGDRFWYENDLTPAEMDRVRGTTLARVIRANTDVGNELQDNVFIAP